ncbi:MAG: 16S rRNA (adenine(1518)-N(6)/adenine(1519)-N(6))-dimethyltransferase RsmA [Promethearchaeota archaeon]
MQFRNHKEEILQIASDNKIVIRKKQGQCFLINEQVADFIIEQAKLDASSDILLEIGPGFGSLTQKLAHNSKHLHAIEIDKKISQYLEKKLAKQENFTLINQDALKIPFPAHTKLISNVPYHISGPLIQKILVSEEKADFSILMLQEEFINRMNAPPQAKGYGRLSVVSQLFFRIELLRKVSRFDFYPQPEVESGIIKLTLKPDFIKDPRIPYFIEFLAGIFPYKNKIIPKAISFLKKNIGNYLKLSTLKEFSLEKEIPLDLKNKRLWQLTPLQIWELFLTFFKKN